VSTPIPIPEVPYAQLRSSVAFTPGVRGGLRRELRADVDGNQQQSAAHSTAHREREHDGLRLHAGGDHDQGRHHGEVGEQRGHVPYRYEPAFDSGTLAAPGTTTDPYGGTTTTPGGSYSTTFSTPGTYAYHCTFHGTLHNMTGTITVTQ